MRGNLLNKSAIMYRWQSGPLHRIANPKNRQFKSDPILQVFLTKGNDMKRSGKR